MVRYAAALGMPSILILLYYLYSSILANGNKIQSKISQIVGNPSPLLLGLV